MCLAQSDFISDYIRKHGRWRDCKLLVELWSRAANESGLARGWFVEVGANVGACTVEMLALTRASVLALEPSPTNLFYLTRTLHRWRTEQGHRGRRRVTVLPVAAGETPKAARLFSRSNNLGHAHLATAAGDDAEGRPGTARVLSGDAPPSAPTAVATVDVLPLDALLPWANASSAEAPHRTTRAHRPMPHVRLMKIDTEGYECQVVKGALQALASGFVQTLALESTGRLLAQQGCSASHLEWFLRVVGYTTVRRSITIDEGVLVAERLD